MVTYATLTELTDYMKSGANPGDSSRFLRALEAASRAIDKATKMPPGAWALADEEETRVFSASLLMHGDGLHKLPTDTFGTMPTSVEGKFLADSEWQEITDWELYPTTAYAYGPGEKLASSATGIVTETAYAFSGFTRIAITTRWGPVTEEPAIKMACLMQASRWSERRSFMGGQGGMDVLGTESMPPVDPDVRSLLAPYARILV